jgi:hypothetical protein
MVFYFGISQAAYAPLFVCFSQSKCLKMGRED